MKLEKIGFYTLEDSRARNVSINSPMWRTEIIITEYCNFKCPYCRGLSSDIYGQKAKKQLSLEEVKRIIDLWSEKGLKNIRFSGGEPTIHPDLISMVEYAKDLGVSRIAISTNGSASLELYQKLLNAGVNDFSVSLDACCADDIDKMAGVSGYYDSIKNAITFLSKKTYVTVGCVFTPDNVQKLIDTIAFANSMGVSDIRIISSAQWNAPIEKLADIPAEILEKYPILKYRVENFLQGRNVRGIADSDCRKCYLMMDDSIIAGDYHFPCVIHMREKGQAIGRVGKNMRNERLVFMQKHDTHKDEICKKNCLDVCVDYNNRVERFKIMNADLNRLNVCAFSYDLWSAGCIHEFDLESRFSSITSAKGREILRKYAIGWSFADDLPCRPKRNHVAVMFIVDNRRFWFHLRNNEFVAIFCR